MQELINQAAALQWAKFTPAQKSIVRIGMIPLEAVTEVQAAMGKTPDFHRLFAVALMGCAKADGGMAA